MAALFGMSAGASLLAAQTPLLSTRAAKAMPTSYSDPLCELKGSHWKTTAATSNLKTALEDTTATGKRIRELEKGREIQLEAIAKNKQDKSSTAWLTLARIYL